MTESASQSELRVGVVGLGPVGLTLVAYFIDAGAFVVACDIPHIEVDCVRKMLTEIRGADIVVPITDDRKYEPLFAIYRKSALDAIKQTLRKGKRKISDCFDKCKVKYIDLGQADWLINVNTPAEYEKLRIRQSSKPGKGR